MEKSSERRAHKLVDSWVTLDERKKFRDTRRYKRYIHAKEGKLVKSYTLNNKISLPFKQTSCLNLCEQSSSFITRNESVPDRWLKAFDKKPVCSNQLWMKTQQEELIKKKQRGLRPQFRTRVEDGSSKVRLPTLPHSMFQRDDGVQQCLKVDRFEKRRKETKERHRERATERFVKCIWWFFFCQSQSMVRTTRRKKGRKMMERMEQKKFAWISFRYVDLL